MSHHILYRLHRSLGGIRACLQSQHSRERQENFWSSNPAWFIKGVPGQLGLHRKTPPQKTKQNEKIKQKTKKNKMTKPPKSYTDQQQQYRIPMSVSGGTQPCQSQVCIRKEKELGEVGEAGAGLGVGWDQNASWAWLSAAAGVRSLQSPLAPRTRVWLHRPGSTTCCFLV